MNELDLWDGIELAQGRLSVLRDRLELQGGEVETREIVPALQELSEMMNRMKARYGLLHEILDRTSEIVFAKDLDGRYSMINPRGAAAFGKSISEVLEGNDRALFEPDVADRIMATDREVMKTGEPRTLELERDSRGVRSTFASTTTAWYDAQRTVRGVIGIAQDVTSKRLGERESAVHRERLRTMAAEIVIAEETLRRTLAAELHGGLGQDIALAKLKLSALRETVGVELREPLTGIEQLVEHADRSLRTITFRLSPPSLHDLGLVAALEWLAEDIDREYGISVHIVVGDSPGVSDERVRVILFRAVRELLVNAASHARVTDVTVRVARRDGAVVISVEDAGTGFDSTLVEGRGNGLFGVREQMRYVRGNMRIVSSPGNGTKVILTAPAPELAAGVSP